MRVTESRMLEQATTAITDARNRVARAGDVMSSGKRVDRPSQDPAAWAQAARAAARHTGSTERGFAISHATLGLAETEDALKVIGANLSRAGEVALQAANGTMTPEDRASLLPILQGLRDANFAASNRSGSDGEYLFSGSRGDQRPFDAAGNYLGDSVTRVVESTEGATLKATLPGTRLTAAGGGVEVLKTIDALILAVQANDVPGMHAANETLKTAVAQVANSRAQVGAQMSALESADEARGSFELRLAETIATAVDADPVEAASDLARSGAALESARVVAQEIVSLLRSAQ